MLSFCIMGSYINSADQTQIYYELSGEGEIALLFAHGWLGNTHWWDEQSKYFSKKYSVVCIDFAGHGKSAKTRTEWSSRKYAEDLAAVANQITSKKIILIGHSMAGGYVLEAFPLISKTVAIILVDTVKDLDQLMSQEQANQIFEFYRNDFKGAVQNMLPQYLFAASTPADIQARLTNEFFANDPEFAVAALEPLYKMDLQALAKNITVPVRGISADYTPTHLENNQKYFKDYDFCTISNSGHYPMLERSEEFNQALEQTLNQLVRKIYN